MSDTNNGQPWYDRVEHEDSIHAKNVIAWGWNGSAFEKLSTTSTPSYATKIDTTTTANVIYIGKAALTGSAISTASAVWQIKKLDTSTIALDKKYADGDANFNNVWDNRASLTYN